MLDSVCKPLFEKSCKLPDSSKIRKGYNNECEIKRMNIFDKLNKYRNNKTDVNREETVRARSLFKSSVRKFKSECSKEKTKFINICYKNIKQYWKLLKQSQQTRNSKSLSADTFAKYFKAINDLQSPFYQAEEDIISFNEVQVIFRELDVEITQTEILESIKILKTPRNDGPDKLLNEFFINSQIASCPIYINYLMLYLTKGIFRQSGLKVI